LPLLVCVSNAVNCGCCLVVQSLCTQLVTATSRCILPLVLQTANIMRTVMELSLKNRLKQYQLVQADVSCDAMGLLDGR
jgi:hypothetical protein